MTKEPRSSLYAPDDWATSKRYLLDGIPPQLWTKVRARAKRDGISLRSLILQLLDEYVNEPVPAHVRAAAPELLAAVQAAAADLDAAVHGRRPPMNPIKLSAQFRAAITKAEGKGKEQ